MKTPIVVRDIFEDLVNEVGTNINNTISANYQAAIGATVPIDLQVQFMHGSVQELVSQLIAKNDSPSQKEYQWPAICLIHNFREGFDKEDCYSETEYTFWILHPGNVSDSYPDRYKKTLEPVIYPLWREFIQVIEDSYKFKYDRTVGIQQTKTDRPMWGKFTYSNEGWELTDHIDGIELQLKLKLYPVTCDTHVLGPEEVKFYN